MCKVPIWLEHTHHIYEVEIFIYNYNDTHYLLIGQEDQIFLQKLILQFGEGYAIK